MTGEDLFLVEAWLAGEEEGACSGDGRPRQVDAGDNVRAGGDTSAQGGVDGVGDVEEDPLRPRNDAQPSAEGQGGARAPERAALGVAGAGAGAPEEDDAGEGAVTDGGAIWVDPSAEEVPT